MLFLCSLPAGAWHGMASSTSREKWINQNPHRGSWDLAAHRKDAGSRRHDAPTPRSRDQCRPGIREHSASLARQKDQFGHCQGRFPNEANGGQVREKREAESSGMSDLQCGPAGRLGGMPREEWARWKARWVGSRSARKPGSVSSRGATGSPS